jgi:hypothetical protein
MAGTTTPTLAPPGEQLQEAPLLAHITTQHTGRGRGLCGKALIGVKAPEDADVCVVCVHLRDEITARLAAEAERRWTR